MNLFLTFIMIIRILKPVPTVIIDPGHGGSNLGAHSLLKNVYEKHLTLDTAKRIKKYIQKKQLIRVILTRTKDKFLTLQQRTEFSKQGDCFVSIHFNTSKVHNRKGFEIFIPNIEAILSSNKTKQISPLIINSYKENILFKSKLLAKDIAHQLDQKTIIKTAWFDIFEDISCPSVLIELGFLDNPQEGKKILNPNYRDQLAKRIANAIINTCWR